MTKWIKKLLGLDNHEEIDQAKQTLFQEKQDAIKALKKINKRFRFVIESEDINLVIRNIDNLRK